ncbi:MAG: sigma 54-interacting transcriptional regulator [bacterium]
MLLEDAGGKMVPRASVNLSLNETLAQMSQKMAAQVLATGEVLQTGNAQQDDRFRIYESVVDLGLQSILALPIRSENRVMGVLSLVHRHRMNAFQDVSLELMLAFADQAGIALENARLVKSLEEAQGRLSRDLQQTQEELDEVRRNISGAEVLKRFIGEKLISGNKAMGELFSVVERLRDTDLSVLLHGESGTGKELIARSLHRKSRRAAKPFVAVNCAALPANLIESELFGYRAGAFTGATRDKKGLIEAAHEGTLFLDEIAELELPLQAKLLRVLEEREVTRLGDVKPVAVDFRLISASHRNLKEEIVLQKFREDLFYRICEIELKFRRCARKEDIPLLAQAFIDEYLGKEGGAKRRRRRRRGAFKEGSLKASHRLFLARQLRELENVIRVATALRKGSILHTEDVPESVRASWGDAKKKASAISPPEPLATFPQTPLLPLCSTRKKVGKKWRRWPSPNPSSILVST